MKNHYFPFIFMTALNCIRFQVEKLKASCSLFVKWSQLTGYSRASWREFLTFIGTRITHGLSVFRSFVYFFMKSQYAPEPPSSPTPPKYYITTAKKSVVNFTYTIIYVYLLFTFIPNSDALHIYSIHVRRPTSQYLTPHFTWVPTLVIQPPLTTSFLISLTTVMIHAHVYSERESASDMERPLLLVVIIIIIPSLFPPKTFFIRDGDTWL